MCSMLKEFDSGTSNFVRTLILPSCRVITPLMSHTHTYRLRERRTGSLNDKTIWGIRVESGRRGTQVDVFVDVMKSKTFPLRSSDPSTPPFPKNNLPLVFWQRSQWNHMQAYMPAHNSLPSSSSHILSDYLNFSEKGVYLTKHWPNVSSYKPTLCSHRWLLRGKSKRTPWQ